MFDLQGYLTETFRLCIRGEEDLHDYQEEAVEWLMARPFSALFIDTGMGKTVISGTLIDRLFSEGFDGKILIIAPIRVANRVWMQEYKLWRHLAYFNPTLLRIDDDDPRLAGLKGFAKTTQKSLLRSLALKNSSARIHVINQEAVVWLVGNYVEKKPNGKLRELDRWPYDVVFYDESSRLRDHGSEGFKALKRVRHRMKRFHQLTATPASQTYMHLFSQIWLLDKGERLGSTITPFREEYFIHNPYDRTYKLRDFAAQAIEEKIADICLVMRRKKNFIIHTRWIDLPKKVIKKYREFEDDSVLELDDAIIEAVNGAALSNKLLQFASGAVYDGNRQYHVIHDEKMEELKQLAEETLDNPIMVAYWYKSSLHRLREAFPKAAVMDKEGKLEESWNRRKHKMMLVHPRSVAHGLNLQFGGHHLALFDIFWPLELFTQLIDRLDRPGQTDTVMVHLLSARGTHDEVVSSNLELLRSAEEAMFARLQKIRARLKQREIEL